MSSIEFGLSFLKAVSVRVLQRRRAVFLMHRVHKKLPLDTLLSDSSFLQPLCFQSARQHFAATLCLPIAQNHRPLPERLRHAWRWQVQPVLNIQQMQRDRIQRYWQSRVQTWETFLYFDKKSGPTLAAGPNAQVRGAKPSAPSGGLLNKPLVIAPGPAFAMRTKATTRPQPMSMPAYQ